MIASNEALDLNRAVKATATEFIQLAALATRVEEARYTASPVPRPREDTDRKSSGGHGDPTSDIALDPRRARLNTSARAAVAELSEWSARVRRLRGELADALATWEGEEGK